MTRIFINSNLKNMLFLNLFFFNKNLVKKMIQISIFNLSFKMLDKKFSLRRIAHVSIDVQILFQHFTSSHLSKQKKYVPVIFVSNRFL